MAVLFAAAHPERVSALVLYGAYAKRTAHPDYPWARHGRGARALRRAAGAAAGTGRPTCGSAARPRTPRWPPGGRPAARAAATPVDRAGPDGHERPGRHPSGAARGAGADPGGAPHRRRSRPGRRTAATWPSTSRTRELVELDGADHFVSGDPDQILDPSSGFVAGSRGPREVPLVLAAIVAVRGERPREALQAADARPGARLRRTAVGDQDVALFDGPATAVRAGSAVLRSPSGRGPEPARGGGQPGTTELQRLRRRATPSRWRRSTPRRVDCGPRRPCATCSPAPASSSRRSACRAGDRRPQRVFAVVAGRDAIRHEKLLLPWHSTVGTAVFHEREKPEPRVTSRGGSRRADLDVDRCRWSARPDRRAALRVLDELGELLGRGVAADGEVHPDPLEAVAHLAVMPRMPRRSMSPSTVEVTSVQRDAARGGDVGQAAGQAGGQGVQQELDRGRGRCRRR